MDEGPPEPEQAMVSLSALWQDAQASGGAAEWAVIVDRLEHLAREHPDGRVAELVAEALAEAWEIYAPLAELRLELDGVLG